jgi:hypothetical protein
MTEQKEEFRGSLTLTTLILTLVFTIPAVMINVFMMNFVPGLENWGGFFVPFFYVIVINDLLGRATKGRLHASIPQLLLLLVPALLVTSDNYFVQGTAGVGNLAGQYFFMIPALANGFTMPWLAQYIGTGSYATCTPSWLLNADKANIIWNGITPTQVFSLADFIYPCLFFSAWMISIIFLQSFLQFGLFARRWVEVEKVPFPNAVPLTYLCQAADINLTEDPKNYKSALFTFKTTTQKVFWTAFIIGIIASIIPIMSEYVPAVAPYGAKRWGYLILPLTFIGDYLKGGVAVSQFNPVVILLLCLLSNDMLYTFVVCWIGLGIIYPYVGTTLGLIPYTPGQEYFMTWDGVNGPWNNLPFPFMVMSVLGMTGGIAIWVCWQQRHRITLAFSTLWKKDSVEYGLSLRFSTIIGLIGAVIMVGLIILLGAPPIIAIIWVVLFSSWTIGSSLYNGYNPYSIDPPHLQAGAILSMSVYGIGAMLGYWSSGFVYGQAPQSWWAMCVLSTTVGYWVFSELTLGTGGGVLYKIAYENKARIGDLFKTIVIVTVVAVTFNQFFQTYVLAHAGGVTHSSSGLSWTVWGSAMTYIAGTSNAWPWETWQMAWGVNLAGIGIILVLYILRSAFSWFFFNPVALTLYAFNQATYTLQPIFAIIIKKLGIRMYGIQRFQQSIIPLAAGIAIGFGATYIIAGFLKFYLVGLTNYNLLWVP